MEATFVDLRTKSKQILEAIRRREPVTLSYRGEKVAVIQPIERKGRAGRPKASDHPAVGMWADREDMADPVAWVREQRRGRFDDLCFGCVDLGDPRPRRRSGGG